MKRNHFTVSLALIAGLFTTHFVQAATKNLSTNTSELNSIKVQPAANVHEVFSFGGKDTSAKLTFKDVTESFYGKNTELLSGSSNDQIFYTKTTVDGAIDVTTPYINAKAVVRNKATWGNETSVASTTSSNFKIGDAVTGDHSHYTAKLIPWVKEAWVDFSVNKALGIEVDTNHNFKFGAFPFKVGRGISLGAAFATSRGILGFYSSGVVDQFAFGSLLYGDIVRDRLSYNLYGAVLENYMDKFSRVNAVAFANEIGRRSNPERGFGSMNLVFCPSLKWKILDGTGNLGKLEVEPYLVFNRAPEQKVEDPSDASSKMATFGMAFEYAGSRVEWGLEFANNFGSQKVRAWDRNKIIIMRDSSDGGIKNYYSHVRVNANNGAKALVTGGAATSSSPNGSGNQGLVNASSQGTSENGAAIANTIPLTLYPSGATLYNASDRFRAAYTNKYKGMMLVLDGSLAFKDDKKFKLVGTVGWASGDESPNANLEDTNDAEVDGDYQGFIGLQEYYAGKRVPSLFLIGDYSAVRPLSSPSKGFATATSGFTNIAYIGTGFDWQLKALDKGCRFKTNVLSYWQDKATKKYDNVNKTTLNTYADKHLGTELNTSLRVNMMESLSGYLVSGVFIPGQHYKDIKGKPLTSKQLAALDELDSTGNPVNGVPVVGTSTSFVLSWGLELSF